MNPLSSAADQSLSDSLQQCVQERLTEHLDLEPRDLTCLTQHILGALNCVSAQYTLLELSAPTMVLGDYPDLYRQISNIHVIYNRAIPGTVSIHFVDGWSANGVFKTMSSGIYINQPNPSSAEITTSLCAIAEFDTPLDTNREYRIHRLAAQINCAPEILGSLPLPDDLSKAHIFFKLYPAGHLSKRMLQQRHDYPTIASSLLDQLRRLHEHKIIHRDIKPTNIVTDFENQVRLTDFGLSLDADSSEKEIQSGGGSPAYLSPEKHLLGLLRNRAKSYLTEYNKIAGTHQTDLNTYLNRCGLITDGNLNMTLSEEQIKEARALPFSYPQYPSDVYAMGITLLELADDERPPCLMQEQENSYNPSQSKVFTLYMQQLYRWRGILNRSSDPIFAIIVKMLDPNSDTRISSQDAYDAFASLPVLETSSINTERSSQAPVAPVSPVDLLLYTTSPVISALEGADSATDSQCCCRIM